MWPLEWDEYIYSFIYIFESNTEAAVFSVTLILTPVEWRTVCSPIRLLVSSLGLQWSNHMMAHFSLTQRTLRPKWQCWDFAMTQRPYQCTPAPMAFQWCQDSTSKLRTWRVQVVHWNIWCIFCSHQISLKCKIFAISDYITVSAIITVQLP